MLLVDFGRQALTRRLGEVFYYRLVKANGSPGEMVRLGQKLLLQHIAKYPPQEDLHVEDLIALE